MIVKLAESAKQIKTAVLYLIDNYYLADVAELICFHADEIDTCRHLAAAGVAAVP